MNLYNTVTDILKEASELPIDNSWLSTDDEDIKNNLTSIIDLDFDFDYVADMIPVKIDESTNETYMEYDNVSKFMESNNITEIDEAMQKICEHYNESNPNITYKNSVLVIESKKSIIKNLKDADVKSKAKVNKTLKDIKNKGIKIACKKDVEECKK